MGGGLWERVYNIIRQIIFYCLNNTTTYFFLCICTGCISYQLPLYLLLFPCHFTFHRGPSGFTVHFILNTWHYTLYTRHCIHFALYTICTVYLTLHIIHFAMYARRYTQYTTLYTTHYAVCTVHSTKFKTKFYEHCTLTWQQYDKHFIMIY